MNKQELIEAVTKEMGSTKAESERYLNSILGQMKKGIKKSMALQLVGFGTFKVVKRKARKGRNPKTGEEIKIKASKSVGFKVGKAFKATL